MVQRRGNGEETIEESENFKEEKRNLRYGRYGLWVGKNAREIRVENEELKEIWS